MEPVGRAANALASDSFSGCFDCNICFEMAREPIVTHCGHLYCWPCIFKWLQVQSASFGSNEHPRCPVCKADISQASMVPLYGCGQSRPESEYEGNLPYQGMVIPPLPPRPAACNGGITIPYQNHTYDINTHSHLEDAFASTFLDLGGIPLTGSHYSYVGSFGEMVYHRVFRNSERLYVYPNSYHYVASSSPRLRRRQMKANRLLSRVSSFLFCFFILCLLLF